MFTEHHAASENVDRLTALFGVEAEMLGAKHRPLRMAVAAIASALVVLTTAPLTSLLVFSTIAFFLVFAAYLVLVADAELARRGEHQFVRMESHPGRR